MDDDISDLRLARFRERQYQRLLSSAPDCRDPSHPGCDRCETLDGEKREAEEDES